jgi:hypothetical protein
VARYGGSFRDPDWYDDTGWHGGEEGGEGLLKAFVIGIG